MSAADDRRVAFEKLFATHYWSVRAYARRRNPSAVDDVVAETFLVAWRRFDSLADDPLPWLFGVARRMLANQQRAERRQGAVAARLRVLGSNPPPGWEPPAEMSGELAAAMASVSARDREALLLVAWEGLEPSRAARAAGCSAAAFRVRLHRARRRVGAQLGERTQSLTNPPVIEEAP